MQEFAFLIVHLLLLRLLLLRLHYSPVRTLSSLMTFSQSALFFYLHFQFVILHLLISVCTQFHHLLFGRPLGRLPYLTYFSYTILSVNTTNPVQPTCSANELIRRRAHNTSP